MLVVFRVVSAVARELDVLFSLFFVVYVLHACVRVNLPLISASYPAPGDRKNRRGGRGAVVVGNSHAHLFACTRR